MNIGRLSMALIVIASLITGGIMIERGINGRPAVLAYLLVGPAMILFGIWFAPCIFRPQEWQKISKK